MTKRGLKDSVDKALKESSFAKDIKRISLFGSYLSGTPRRDSDIDLLIEFSPKARIGLLALMAIKEDLERLRTGGVRPTRGDARCIAHGHIIRVAIWNLRNDWIKHRLVEEKIRFVADAVQSLGGALGVEKYLPNDLSRLAGRKGATVREAEAPYGPNADEIPF